MGRESGDILLHDPEASALHAEIEFTNGRVIVRDLGSRNGTLREGKRLPQFALYHGQTFRCGTTDITLTEIHGTEAPVAGGTASGNEKVSDRVGASSSTLPSSSPSAAVTLASGPIPSSTGTAPGTGTTPVDESTPTLPAPGMASAAAPVAPPTAAPFGVPGAAAPPGSPGPMPTTGPAPGPGAPTPVPGVPTPVPTAPSAPIAPVANAVIKLGDAQPRAARHRGVGRAARGRLIKRILLSTVVAAAVIGLAFGIYSLIAGRNQAFLKQLAREMPGDTISIVALSSPKAALELLGDEIPEAVREEAKAEFGLDPFDPEALGEWGIDLEAPAGTSLLDSEGIYALSMGVSDKDVLRSALSEKAAELLGEDENLRWIERSFGETPGLWLDEPAAVAALLPGKRVIFVFGGPPDDVARHAKRVAETQRGESLADREGFGEIARVPGKVLIGMYVDGGSARSALPSDEGMAMGVRLATADFDGFAMLLSDDGPRLHLSTQLILRDGVDSLSVFEEIERKGQLIDKIPDPILAEIDMAFSPDATKGVMGSFSPLGMGAMAEVEEEIREETGLNIRSDVLDNLDGQVGWALLRLPRSKQEREEADDDDDDDQADEFGMVLFAGVKDEEAAKETARRFYDKTRDDIDFDMEVVDDVTVWVVDERPALRYFIHDKTLWGAIGNVDVRDLIKGGHQAFRKRARIPAIAEAASRGGQVGGFVDIKTLVSQIRDRLDDDEKEAMDGWSPLIDPLEALTLHGELDGRTMTYRWTLHTTHEHALAGLVQGVVEVVGEELAEKLAAERRRERCQTLIDHILELMQAELKGGDFESDLFERRAELLDECTSDETTDAEIDCMVGASSLEGLTRCEGGGDGASPASVLEQPEPNPVPFIDDIWPNTQASGTATGRPDAAVNYRVEVGESPTVRGAEDALVTVVMFGDFQCPYSKRSLGTLDELLAADREVRLVFRHNPLPMHEGGEPAARAAIAAGQQGKFWQMHDKLYDNQHALTEDNFRLWADELGLDLVQFDRDFSDPATAEHVRADMDAARKLGATSTPSFFVNGRYLQGAQPLHAFQTLANEEKGRAERFVERRGNTRRRLYADMIEHFAPEVISPITTPVATPTSETRYTLATTDLPRRGSPGFVRVEIVECGDFDCPFCKRSTTVMDKVLTDYEGKVALFWMHNPLSFHPGAEPAARAAVAAGNQGKFWEMHDKLFESSSARDRSDFVDFARDLGLDVGQFESDLDAPATATTVTEQRTLCTDNDARGTPTFFVNGRLMSGAQSYDRFKDVIEQELAGGI